MWNFICIFVLPLIQSQAAKKSPVEYQSIRAVNLSRQS